MKRRIFDYVRRLLGYQLITERLDSIKIALDSLLLQPTPTKHDARTASISDDIKDVVVKQLSLLEPNDRALFLRDEFDRAAMDAYPPNPYKHEAFDYNWFAYASATQSTIFYADILPVLAEWLSKTPRNSTLKLLDVGGASGCGAEFLAKIFYSHFTGYKIIVDVIDTEDTYVRLSRIFNKHINSYAVKDLFEFPNNSYDICICSHVIEHLNKDRLNEFVRKVIDVAAGIAIFCAPYKEEDLYPGGHLYSVDDEVLSALPKPTTRKVYRSLGWYRPNQDAHCVMFAYEKGSSRNLEG